LYLDTHAGTGLYDLTSAPALAHGEHRSGIDALRQLAARTPVPDTITRYLEVVAARQKDPRTPVYPGSPPSRTVLRSSDRLVVAERHPADRVALTRLFERARNVRVEAGDGYALLRSELPPREGRGVVLIDPAYELESEPASIVEGLGAALRRFRHGVYLIWYPLTGKLDHRRLIHRIERLAPPALLRLGSPVRPACWC
jgi:23S rRNA (adenine2030-N6)-methyltransferase